MPTDDASRVFHERRRVPWWWWLVSLAVAVPSVEVVAVYAPEMTSTRSALIAVIALVVTVAVVAAGLLAASRSTVLVDRSGLHVDGTLLPVSSIGRVRVLDRESARLVLGRDARADAHLSIRPWLHTAVQIEVDDAADPTPYWVVATKRPEQLAQVLAQARNGSGKASRETPTDEPLGPAAGGEEHLADTRRIEANSE